MALGGTEAPYGVLAVGGGATSPPAADAAWLAADAADSWWHAASFGHWRPRAVALPPVMLASDPAGWCAGGGMGVGPRNAAGLAREALLALPRGTRCPEHVVLVVAGPVAAHAWRVAGGGVAIAPGRWVRRYAAMPAAARLGVWAHELAHLLLGWPDLPGSACLMGDGANRDAGRTPAPPGPALASAAGWLDLLPAAPDTPATAIGPGQAMELAWRGRALLVTCDGPDFAIHDRRHPAPALASGRLADPGLPLLSGIAGALAGLSWHAHGELLRDHRG